MDAFGTLCKILLILGAIFYFLVISRPSSCPASNFFTPFLKTTPIPTLDNINSDTIKAEPASTSSYTDSPTNLSHLAFGLVGSEKAWHHRKAYIESWWQPNATRGLLFLDEPPSPDLLPWSPASPEYRISANLTDFLNTNDVTPHRIINGIMEAFRGINDHENLRWLVMGDDDSIFFVDNMVDVLAKYDHTKYYYLGGQSEFIMSNFWFSFSQGFGGAGFILSYPLAKAMADGMEDCLRRYRYLNAADQNTMSCVADLGVSLTPLKGIHQIDLRGDLSGLLSSHPNFPLMSLHHFDVVEPIFPSMDRFQSTRHLMKAANADQSRMLQQTVCYHRETNWSFSISWGYSAHIYENIIPRSVLQYPIETFKTWMRHPNPPHYMFNTRLPTSDPCQAPHVFFLDTVERTVAGDEIVSSYNRRWPRGSPACATSGNHSAEHISVIQVFSPATKRLEIDRSECCDIVRIDSDKAEIKFRECRTAELIA